MRRGEIRWLGEPGGDQAGTGNRGGADGGHPVLVVQQDEFNDSRIPTVLSAVITSDMKLAHAPGNVFLSGKATGLDRDAVADVARLMVCEKESLSAPVGRIAGRLLREVDDGLRLVLGI